MEATMTTTNKEPVTVTLPDDDNTVACIIPPIQEVPPDGTTNDDNSNKEDYGDLIDEDNKRAFEVFNMKARMNDIKRISEDINNKTKEVIDDEELDDFDRIAMSFNEGEIEKLSDEEIEKLYENDGNPIELSFDFENPKDTIAFKRDFLEFRRQSIATSKALDEETENMNKMFEEYQEEVDEIMRTYGTMDGLIKTTLEKRLEEAETEERKELIRNLIKNFDYGLSLDNIKDFVNSYKGRSTIGYYRDVKQSQYIYRRYRKVCDTFNIKTDLSKFPDLEKNFIGEEYNERPNIFLFTVIYYISTFANKTEDKTISLFLTQLSINLKNLVYNKFDEESKKETFVNNIKTVIEMIG